MTPRASDKHGRGGGANHLEYVGGRHDPSKAGKELPKLVANRPAFGQATIRHAVFGIVLGLLEDALNGPASPGRTEHF